MSNVHQQTRAASARAALAASQDGSEDLPLLLRNHLTDLGHLCDAEKLSFTEILAKAIRYWAVERIDPNSIAPGPDVQILIGTEGLPEIPKKKPGKPMPKKSRPA
jgi:hypothetical protein